MNKIADTSSVENFGSSFQAISILNEHGVKLFSPASSNNSQGITFGVCSLSGSLYMHFMINAFSGSLEFELPEYIEQRRCNWKRWIDTSLESPYDISDISEAPGISEKVYNLCPYSIAILTELK
jgi:isoamylase